MRFGAGGGLVLSLKLFLTWAIEKTGVPLWLNYGFVHVIVVVISYKYHSAFTFKVQPSISHFWRFFMSVAALKIVDYAIVVLINNIDALNSYFSAIYFAGPFLEEYLLYITIIGTTIPIFFIRYFLFKKVVFAPRS